MTSPEQLLERLVADERASPNPPDEAGERVWAAIEDRLANGPAPPELDDGPLFDHAPELAAAGSRGGSSVVLKLVGAVAVVGVVAGGLALVLGREPAPASVPAPAPDTTAPLVEPSTPPEPAAAPPRPPEPVAAPEPEPVEPEPVEPETPATTKPKPKPAPAPAPAKSLADEVALMQALSTALKRGDSSKVLALVAEHERDFASGQFIEERRAAKARGLCQAGKLATGKQEAARFVERWPSSIHVAAVEQDCGIE